MGIKDPTFRLLGELPTRSEAYEAYRREWERRRVDMDSSDHPVHVDIETVAVRGLRCGSSEDDEGWRTHVLLAWAHSSAAAPSGTGGFEPARLETY